MRAPSILQSEKKCYLTKIEPDSGGYVKLDCHHIYFSGNRETSDENGFWVWLEHNHHIQQSPFKTPHNDREIDLKLKKECQRVYEKTHTREEFMALIGRNYL